MRGAGHSRGRSLTAAGVALAAALLLTALAGAHPALAKRAAGSQTAPFVITPGAGLYQLFGYAPDFTRSMPTFDAQNRPYLRSRSADPDYTAFVQTLRDGRWQRHDLLGALRAAYPRFDHTLGGAGGPGNRVVFDTADRAYTILTIALQDGSSRNVLLWSTDHCSTWSVTGLPAGEVGSEFSVGHNTISGPPLLLITQTLSDIDPATNQRRRTILVSQPYFDGHGITVPAGQLVTTHTLASAFGSGDASSVVTHGDMSEIVWTETTRTPALGAPTYVASFDHVTLTMGPRVQVATTMPANDGHARAGICLDSKGHLHVVTGAHGTPFMYTRSLAPDTPYSGWTTPVPVATSGYAAAVGAPVQSGQQTYLALTCDASDTLHVAYRQWRRNTDPYFGGALYGSLSYQDLAPGGVWSPPQVLVVPPYPGYELFFQQLGTDLDGRLYLAAAVFSGPEVQQRKAQMARWQLKGGHGPQPPMYLRRMLLTSDDHGRTWRLATTADFVAGVHP